MPLMSLRNVSLSYGQAPLLDQVNLMIEAKERICLIGRNGAGKSSLFKLLLGEVLPDSGKIEHSPSLKAAILVQEIPTDLSGTVGEFVATAFDSDEENHWQHATLVEKTLSKMQLNAEQCLNSLSGGMMRRVLLAKALATDPDILLLDEPTNHLDIDTIVWLENLLLNFNKTVLFITHDRSLARKLATRIIELDRGQLHSWNCSYDDYLTRKAEQLSAETKANELFDKRLSEEERWIRKGIQARRTRNEGRVRQLKAMRIEHQQRRNQIGTVNLKAQSIEHSGKLVFTVDNISYQHDENIILKNFSTIIARGDKIGIIGPNGCGKSTFLRLLLEQLKPTHGTIKRGANLNISYFDQTREQLDDEKTVMDNIHDGCDTIEINGQSVHVMSYLKDFLFTPERARSTTRVLSGGERHRLLLARLFTKPANLLILDEPTNDLDAETLELLEEHLLNYKGTLLLVSHDRDFIDRVVTSTIAFEGEGKLERYVGGYQDYLLQRSTPQPENKPTVKKAKPKQTKNKNKMAQKQRRDIEALHKKIEQLEKEQQALTAQLSQPDFYKESSDTIAKVNAAVKQNAQEIAAAYADWEAIENTQ